MATAWRSILAVAVVLALASAMGTTQAMGQQQGAPDPATTMDKGHAGAAKWVEGTIQTVSGNTLTLTDGTVVTIPDSVKVQRKDLKPGASVKASYEEKAGRKILTSLEVEAAR